MFIVAFDDRNFYKICLIKYGVKQLGQNVFIYLLCRDMIIYAFVIV